jgi:hypothetical protein
MASKPISNAQHKFDDALWGGGVGASEDPLPKITSLQVSEGEVRGGYDVPNTSKLGTRGE